MTIIDSIKGYIPPKVSETYKQASAWGKESIVDTKLYKKSIDLTAKGLDSVSVNTAAYSLNNTNAEKTAVKWTAKIAEKLSPAALKTKDFLVNMGAAAKSSPLLTKGMTALAVLFEAPDIIEGFKEGRGVDQSIQSAAKVGAGVAGTAAGIAGAITLGVISGPVGWAALAVGAVGGAVGYAVGDKATSFLGHNKKGLLDSEPEPVHVAAAPPPVACPYPNRKPGRFGLMTGQYNMNYIPGMYSNPNFNRQNNGQNNGLG